MVFAICVLLAATTLPFLLGRARKFFRLGGLPPTLLVFLAGLLLAWLSQYVLDHLDADTGGRATVQHDDDAAAFSIDAWKTGESPLLYAFR